MKVIIEMRRVHLTWYVRFIHLKMNHRIITHAFRTKE